MDKWIVIFLIFITGFLIGYTFGVCDTRHDAIINNVAHYYMDKFGKQGFTWDK